MPPVDGDACVICPPGSVVWEFQVWNIYRWWVIERDADVYPLVQFACDNGYGY